MSYEFLYQNDGFYLTHKGLITIDEINEANGQIQGHPEFDEHKFQLINLLEADFSEIVQKASREPGATDSVASRSLGKVVVALVVVEAKAVAFCRDYIAAAVRFGATWDFQIFPDVDGATAWIEAQSV